MAESQSVIVVRLTFLRQLESGQSPFKKSTVSSAHGIKWFGV